MVSNVQNRRAQLTIPKMPKFPLSSPITEEIPSPASSSSEDREMERHRPFEFLAKMSSRNPFVHRPELDSRSRGREDDTTYASNGRRTDGGSLTTYVGRKAPERPVGLNLVTDLPQSTLASRKDTAAPFVDLNDLKLLSRAREDERSAQRVKGILKRENKEGFHRLPDDPPDSGGGERASWLDVLPKSPKKKVKEPGISPTDRPIVIGYSVPYNESPEFREEKSRELDSAGTQQTPLTPSIIVTPAKEDGFWLGLSAEHTRPRATSSVYSQPTPYLEANPSGIPPVPALPASYSTEKDQGKSSDLLQWPSVSPVRKRRSFSAGAVNEKDGEQQPTRRSRSYSNESINKPSVRLTINTQMNGRASQGWWNYLLSPLLSRTSTLLSRNTPTETKRPPVPTVATHSTGLSNERWEEKEVSYFSPDTPDAGEATRNRIASWQNTAGNPFADFDWSIDEQPENTKERGTASLMSSGQRIQGAAAEYYQACAHELFSGRPYFECINHVCSITPKDKIPGFDASPSLDDRQEDRNLLIDVDDMPRSGDLASPQFSVTSINSEPSEGPDTMGLRLRASLNNSPHEPTPGRHLSESPKSRSPVPDAQGGPAETPWNREVQQPYNPFEQPREFPPPVTNVYVQPAASHPPANIHVEASPAHPPANIHIETPAAPPPSNINVQAPPAQPHPIRNDQGPAPAVQAPMSMPSPEQVPPPSYGKQPRSPYPPSPESLQEVTERSGGTIRLSDMPAGPAPAYTPHDNNTALPPRVIAAPITREATVHPVAERDRIENRRRRLEREDAIGRTARGLWRGRGPFSNKGCFGRPGREGRLWRRWYLVIFIAFLLIVVGAVLLAIFLTRSGDATPVQSQWLNLTGYPPMPTGISTIAGPEPQVQDPGCITPPTLWSCALPKEQQTANEPYTANRPNFRMEIRFLNGTYNRSTAPASPSAKLLSSRSTRQLFNPSPKPADIAEQEFLGNTTDGNSAPYAGEETPFYITFLSAAPLSSSHLTRRSDSNPFPDLSSLIPQEPVDSDGTAAAATLYPLPSSQPVRLYNRGQKDEHYGFYTYFDKSIFLESSIPLTGRKDTTSSRTANNTNTDGGSSKSAARVRCTWSQTRFLVQIWTKPEQSGKKLLDRRPNSASATASPTATSTSQTTSSSSATDFTRPGSFPYPVTITLDRHGGAAKKKMVYCYGMADDQRINGTEKKLQIEDRGFNGVLVNPAPGIFNMSLTSTSDDEDSRDEEEDYGGYDGGTGGCSCQWVNWIGRV